MDKNTGTASNHESSTVRDVAARAGVSASTVSRVLGGTYPVAKETRSRVLRAMRELDYVVNAHARALGGSTNKTVAFVVDDVTGPFYAYIARGVEEQAAAEGRLCMLCTTHGDPRRVLAVVETMREQRADAVIVVGGGWEDKGYQDQMTHFAHALDRAGSRLVLVGRGPLGKGVPVTVVDYDNEGGAFAMTTHLLSSGRRQVVYLGKVPGLSTSTQRIRGFVRAHEMLGVPHDPALIVDGVFSRGFGYQATRKLIASGTGFDALFAGTDMVAAGALQALREEGVRVPEDVAVAGYDDIPTALDVFPALTTVNVPHEELGRAAVRLALHREEFPESQHQVFGTHVVVRDSTRYSGR
ncbi:LacI family DNA-binding transcriptional regulator [Streptomyces sp. CBMA29]|uniref:LacI family DNA-binding transcriptional regulator n=1 Tax=Streptomyces sp. CBMA29 TaxID=1896314 RepID=UPI001661A04D|nr:LacI family DNA-binding transcriptional regulator [Streptomyces sp. CBMA29]MBD0735688.1 LacI family transcriptional regulator [Streptomyces sp. CBMA29]